MALLKVRRRTEPGDRLGPDYYPGEELIIGRNLGVDISALSPDRQYLYLVGELEADDLLHPAPFTGSPPWGEYDYSESAPDVSEAVMSEQFIPPADLESAAGADLETDIEDAAPPDGPAWTWYNDDQRQGAGVPPGVPGWADQPIESGHTQIVLIDPSAEQGWDAFTGKPYLPRLAFHGNDFPAYQASQSRGHGIPVEKMVVPLVLQTQQKRNQLFAALKRKGVHNVVVSDVPSVSNTDNTTPIDPLSQPREAPIGPEGVMPW